jgi:NAD(P)-dependent dehydrogenase (short-subunit alcohol dehydrogenase family)
MRIVVVGGTGTIGKAIVAALSGGHEVLVASRSSKIRVDIADPDSIRSMYRSIGDLDAVVSASGDARFRPLEELSDEDFAYSLRHKLMGQVNLVRYGMKSVRDGGSFTLTSGVLARRPMPGSGAVSLVNAGLEGFGRAAALEAPRGIRVNVVAPPWITDTLRAFGMDPSQGMTPEAAARLYLRSVTGRETGATIE